MTDAAHQTLSGAPYLFRPRLLTAIGLAGVYWSLLDFTPAGPWFAIFRGVICLTLVWALLASRERDRVWGLLTVSLALSGVGDALIGVKYVDFGIAAALLLGAVVVTLYLYFASTHSTNGAHRPRRLHAVLGIACVAAAGVWLLCVKFAPQIWWDRQAIWLPSFVGQVLIVIAWSGDALRAARPGYGPIARVPIGAAWGAITLTYIFTSFVPLIGGGRVIESVCPSGSLKALTPCGEVVLSLLYFTALTFVFGLFLLGPLMAIVADRMWRSSPVVWLLAINGIVFPVVGLFWFIDFATTFSLSFEAFIMKLRQGSPSAWTSLLAVISTLGISFISSVVFVWLAYPRPIERRTP